MVETSDVALNFLALELEFVVLFEIFGAVLANSGSVLGIFVEFEAGKRFWKSKIKALQFLIEATYPTSEKAWFW